MRVDRNGNLFRHWTARHLGLGSKLRGIWIDAGTRDDFNLDVGASAFRAALLDAGVEEDLIRFELFDATHSGIDYRYPLSLAWLCERITDLLCGGAYRRIGSHQSVDCRHARLTAQPGD